MLGGLYKKSTYIKDARKKEKNLVLVDSGDLLNEHEKIKDSFMSSARLKAEMIIKVNKDLGIDAINVGELDLGLGLDYLKELEKKYDVPFVSANIVDEKGKLVFKPYVIKKLDNLKVGITGVIRDKFDGTLKELSGGVLSVKDHMETLNAVVPDLKGQVDFVIVMSHMAYNSSYVTAKKIDGIDLIVCGHQKKPKLKNAKHISKYDSYLVLAGEKGQYQGMLEVTLASDNTKTVKNALVPMGGTIKDDAQVKAMIDKYNMDVNKLYTVGDDNKDEKVTLKSESCNECHSDIWESWQKTDHAKAFQTLINKGKQFNPDCLVCHTTMFEQPGGFTMEEQQKDLRNVQCESCHGDSTAHLEDPGEAPGKDPGLKTCLKCHTESRCPDFEEEYESIWEKIKH